MPIPFDAKRLTDALGSILDFQIPDGEAVLRTSQRKLKNSTSNLHKVLVHLNCIRLMTQENTSSEKPFKHFDFDLARAVLEQLVEVFDSLPIGPLEGALVSQIDETPGVYMLFVSGRLHYIGKADKNLSGRLMDHLWTLRSRKNIDINTIGFKGVTVHRNWTPLTHEESLIKHYKGAGLCEWNTKGLGNHDPGRRREDTETNDFDSDYPIDENFVPEGIDPRLWNARDLLRAVKDGVPFVFRFHTDKPKGGWRKGSVEYNILNVTVPHAGMSIRELLQLVIDTFPEGWQATFFRSHVILYEEERTYTHATLVLRRP